MRFSLATPGWRVAAAGVLTAAVLLLVGAFLVRTTRHDESNARPTGGPDRSSSSPPPRTADPAGRTDAGAVAAALRYTADSQRWLYLTNDALASALQEITTEEARDRLTAEIGPKVQGAQDRLRAADGRIWWLVRPLAWRLERAGDAARVEVWSLGVLSAAGVAAPQAEWSTLTFDLLWVDDEWRIDGLTDEPGPTPMTGPADDPWDARQLDATLAGFTRLDGETMP
jgi:hypothetical protein